MPQRETIITRIPREGLVSNVSLRVSCRMRGSRYVRGVHIREWWLPPMGENSIPTERGVVIHPSELDAVIAALTEAKSLLASTRAPWGRSTPCPRCQSPEARQARRAGAAGSFPSDYYCGLCGAVDGPLRPEPPVRPHRRREPQLAARGQETAAGAGTARRHYRRGRRGCSRSTHERKGASDAHVHATDR